MQFHVRRIHNRHVIHAVAFHVGGNVIRAAENRIRPHRLPRKTDPRLPVIPPLVSVVIRPDLRRSRQQVEVHVVPRGLVAARCRQLVAQPQVQRQRVGCPVVVLRKARNQAVPQVEVERHPLLHVLRQPQQKVRERISEIPVAARVLPVERERSRRALVPRVHVVHDVVVVLEAAVDRVLAMRPRQRVLRLKRRVVENLHAVRAPDPRIPKAHRRKNVLLHPRQIELLRQIPAHRIA